MSELPPARFRSTVHVTGTTVHNQFKIRCKMLNRHVKFFHKIYYCIIGRGTNVIGRCLMAYDENHVYVLVTVNHRSLVVIRKLGKSGTIGVEVREVNLIAMIFFQLRCMYVIIAVRKFTSIRSYYSLISIKIIVSIKSKHTPFTWLNLS